MVGYSGFRGTVGGESLRFQQGMFRFKPDGSTLDSAGQHQQQLRGLGFKRGRGFPTGSTYHWKPERPPRGSRTRYYAKVSAASSPSVLLMISEDNYMHPDHRQCCPASRRFGHGKFTAGCGHVAVHLLRTLPEGILEPHRIRLRADGKHLVATFHEIEPFRSDVQDEELGWNLLASDDERGPRRSWRIGRAGRERMGDRLVQPHRLARTRRRKVLNGRGNACWFRRRQVAWAWIYRIGSEGRQALPMITTLKDATPGVTSSTRSG